MTSDRNRKIFFVNIMADNTGLGWTALLVFFVLLVLLPGKVSAFNVPEKLIFDLTWTGLKAGTATLEIVNEKDRMKIISTARSSDWLSAFYMVDDRTESVLKNTPTVSFIGLPENYRIKLREGRHRRDKEAIFDHANRQVTFIDHIRNEKKNYKIGENTFDPLSGFYFIRTMKYEVGKSVYVDIFDSKKLWNVEVQVLRKERIKTELGQFDTVVIKPLMKSEGIFNRKGDMYIWLTDDLRRVPVKMQTKVAVGYITATLTGGSY
ncbi:MAG: DUF3108 domain-containing protein [Thermodesulfovibrionales bacterium]